MAEKWYEGLPEEVFLTETDKAYKKAFFQIQEGLKEGLDFDSACAAVEIDDMELKKNIVDDMLKVIIAEEFYKKNIPLDKIAAALKVSDERLESAKAEMLEDVKNTSIKAFYAARKPGNA